MEPVPLVPPHVLAAFGVPDADPMALEGGQGSSIRAGGLVLKPYAAEAEVAWFAGLVTRTRADGFRLPAPVATVDGAWTCEGWSAVEHVVGAPVDDDERTAAAWIPVLTAGRAFHAAVRREPRPAHLDDRSHRWALADRASWDPAPAPAAGPGSTPLLERLLRLRAPVALPDQLVHGDLSGNVLLAPGIAPAVIDVSPYWRPSAYADAVVVVDALLWWRTEPDLVDLARPRHVDAPTWCSLLARAAVFRLLSLDEATRADDAAVVAQLPDYDRLISLLEASARRHAV